MRVGMIAVLFSVLVCSVGFADEIVFKNGERLVGKFERMEEGKTVFKSELAGEVAVDLSHVKHIYSDTPIKIHLEDGSIVESRRLEREADRFTVESTDVARGQTLVENDILAINPPTERKVRWSGSVTAGFTSSHGDSFSEQANISASLTRRSEKHRIRVEGLYFQARDDENEGERHRTTDENYFVSGKYDYFLTKRVFGYWSESFKKDRFSDLDYRIISGFGAGYQWLDTKRLDLSPEAGFAYLQEKYTNKEDVTDASGSTVRVREVDRKNEFALQLGYHFKWEPYERVTFMSKMTYNPSFRDFSDYFISSEAEFRTAVTKRFFSNFKFILDYDSTPGEGSGTTDTKYIAGFGLNL